MLGTVSRPKIRDLVAQRLSAHIADQELKLGDRLPNDNELATSFGVSRLSLREATKALEYLGIVEAIPGRGLSVGQTNLERMTGYLAFHPSLREAPPKELICTRVVIETGILPYVLQRMQADPTICQSLDEFIGRMRRAHSLSDRVTLDVAFHRRLVEAGGLSPLLTFSDLLAAFFRRFRESVGKADWQSGIESHQRVIDALRAGQLDTARQELQHHIEWHQERTEGQ